MTTPQQPAEAALAIEGPPPWRLTRNVVLKDPHAADRMLERATRAGWDVFSWMIDSESGDRLLYAELRTTGQAAGSFADAPVSVAEIRADRSGSANDLSPRDILVRALRDLDTGKIKPAEMAIIYTDDGAVRAEYSTQQHRAHTVGMLQMALHSLIDA